MLSSLFQKYVNKTYPFLTQFFLFFQSSCINLWKIKKISGLDFPIITQHEPKKEFLAL